MNNASEPGVATIVRPRLPASGADRVRRRQRATVWRFLGVTLTSLALLVGAAIPAAAADLMRVTFVRHGESEGNASGLIDTSTPGPVLTELGQQQARDVVGTLGANNYDGMYASTMVRTQLTAAPMSDYLRLPVQVLPGLQEIEAGVFEGTPESEAAEGYAQFPLAWAFQNMRDLRIPGSIDGHEFDARVDGALQTIYDNGDRNAVVFSHGGAIMFWTMMNAQNLTLQQKINLLRTAALDNTDYVVIEGNPEDGWTLTNWNGQLFSPEPTLGAEVRLQARTLSRQLAATAQQVLEAFATRDVGKIVTAITQGIGEAAYSIVKFGRAVGTKVVHEFSKADTPAGSSDTAATTSVAASGATTTSTAATHIADETSTAAADPDAAATSTPNTDKVASLRGRKAASATDDSPPQSGEEAVQTGKKDETPRDGATTNGATDLTDGNKVTPGQPAAGGQGGDQASGGADVASATDPDAEPATDTEAQTTAADGANDEGGRQREAA